MTDKIIDLQLNRINERGDVINPMIRVARDPEIGQYRYVGSVGFYILNEKERGRFQAFYVPPENLNVNLRADQEVIKNRIFEI